MQRLEGTSGLHGTSLSLIWSEKVPVLRSGLLCIMIIVRKSRNCYGMAVWLLTGRLDLKADVRCAIRVDPRKYVSAC